MRAPNVSGQRSSGSVPIGLTVALLVGGCGSTPTSNSCSTRPTTHCGRSTWHGVTSIIRQWSRCGSDCRRGDSAASVGVRALGTLAAAAGTGVVYLLSWQLFDNRAEATFAGLLYCSMLLIAAGAIIVTPDTPLLFFWSIALYAVIQIYRGPDGRWWAVAGTAMGLALQSKYTALLLGAGILCSMILVPRMRAGGDVPRHISLVSWPSRYSPRSSSGTTDTAGHHSPSNSVEPRSIVGPPLRR